MAEDCPKTGEDSPELKQSEKEVLMTEYQEVREEVRENGRLLHTRISRGIAAIGAVIGYALLAPGGEVFISIVPLIIGVIYLLTLNSIQNMLTSSRRSYDIEEKIMPEGQGFEHQYGGLLPHDERETTISKYPQVDLSDISSLMVGVFSGTVYVAFIIISVIVIEMDEGLMFAVLISLFYVILTIILGVATWASRKVFYIRQPDNF